MDGSPKSGHHRSVAVGLEPAEGSCGRIAEGGAAWLGRETLATEESLVVR